MFLIYIIIVFHSFNGILPTNLTKNSSLNHTIIISLCQANKISIPIRSHHHSYFYFSNQSSSSFSASLLPSFHLSYCEHQQTTYSLSSGFSILLSSPRFLLTDIVDKEHSISFHHNATHSTTDHLLSSTTTNTITTMSSTPFNENPVPIGNDNSLITTTILSNISLLHTSLATTHDVSRTFKILLSVGCLSMGILLMIILYIIIKYCNRDEGSYKIDESINFATKSDFDNQDKNMCTGKISLSSHHRQKLLTTNEHNLSDSKEWYV